MSILITGFEPFDGATVNPSWEAVLRVPLSIGGHAVHRMQLPVVYRQAAAEMLVEINRLRPTLVVCCGVAAGRGGVTPELVALNYRHAAIPDNAGQKFSGEPILPHGETALMTSLPVQEMIDAIRAREIPAWLSLSAGAYVCNDLYYHLLLQEEELGYRGIFIHVPDAQTVDADRAAAALTACIETALRHV